MNSSNSSARFKSHDNNPWPPPTSGLDFDWEGPTADRLIDVSFIYDQTVFQDVRPIKDEWTIVDEIEAEAYLPSRKDPLPVTVGVEEKKTETLSTLKSMKLDDYMKYKKGYILNTGGSIWGLDFAPKSGSSDTDPSTQYLAVSGYRGSVGEHVSLKTIQPTGTYKNAIQIWKLKLSVQQPPEDAVLDLCLLHDFGVVYDLKWCPYGTYESQGNDNELYKLGILSFACGDGTIRTIVVPHPDAVRKCMCSNDTNPTKTVYMRINSSRCTFSPKTSYATSISWGGHKKLATGSTIVWHAGTVSVWNMELALKDKNSHFSGRHLTLTSLVLDSAVRGLSWHGIFEPEKISVCGLDGQHKLFDTNDPFVPLHITRIRGVYSECSWAGHCPMIFSSDSDNNIKGTWINRDGTPSSYKYGVCPGFCWSIATSEHHGNCAIGSSIGWMRSLNAYQYKIRSFPTSQYTIYKLHYDEQTQTYRYIDGLGFESFSNTKKYSYSSLYGDTHMAIQKVVWNPNKHTAGFIASGGAAGLCRVEFEGRGSKWT